VLIDGYNKTIVQSHHQLRASAQLMMRLYNRLIVAVNQHSTLALDLDELP